MTTQTATYTELIERLTPEVTLTLHDISWETYEELLAAVGEAPALRISYNEGVMQVMTVSFEHEYFSEFLNHLVGRLSAVLRQKILFFGRATMKKQKKLKGSEPDACFYVQSAVVIGNKFRLDLNVDPPPDIVVEIDLHHDSLSKLPIYAALGVPEVWRYDGQELTIYQLQIDHYALAQTSRALPVLTSEVLTDFLERSQQENQYETLLAFEEWLRAPTQ
jgi:Uma2 family endonuclease